jgi:DNA-binding IclR family transcriptional regulator
MLERTRKTQGVNAVNRALALLNTFLDGKKSLSLADLTKRTQLVKPTVLRLLLSLESSGYVVRLENGKYQLGAKVMQLGSVYRANFALEGLILPVLQHLSDITKETASFHVREGDNRVCLFRVESPQLVRVFMVAGSVHPMDKTATGMVLRIYHDKGAQTRSKKRVFLTSGIRDFQTASLAAPVFGDNDRLVGALTVTAPIARFQGPQSAKVTPLLLAAASKLSRALGATTIPTEE